jgi:uncharacterized protein (TIGR00251 family)
MPPIIKKPDGILLKIFVQPKSSKNEIVGVHDDAIKIRLTAPPVDNAANEMCVKFFSKQLGISKSSMNIISGHTSRLKQIFIRCAADSGSTLSEKIEAILSHIENQIKLKKP